MNNGELELILQAQKGNMSAFEQLVQKYDKQVISIALKYVNSSEDAKDIYQEVFLRVYKGLPKFQLKSEFSTWLFRITTNVCLSYKSVRQKQKLVSLDQSYNGEEGESHTLKDTIASDASTDSYTCNKELSNRIEDALKSLPARQRMVFTLKHYEGYKLREIAVMMNCTEGTVKRYLFEAIRRLRNQLEDLRV